MTSEQFVQSLLIVLNTPRWLSNNDGTGRDLWYEGMLQILREGEAEAALKMREESAVVAEDPRVRDVPEEIRKIEWKPE
jgi:hypothetical protein